MDYREADVLAELTNALDEYEESEGHQFDLAGNYLTVTGPDGDTAKFKITVRKIEE
jgi:hypothetical protein